MNRKHLMLLRSSSRLLRAVVCPCATNVVACVVSNAALSSMINVSLSSHSSSQRLLASPALNVAQLFAVLETTGSYNIKKLVLDSSVKL